MLNDWIFLYGPPGSGKSSKGRRLAQALNLPFVDLDEQVEKACGSSIPEIFADQGEAQFRQIEKRMLLQVLDCQPGVIALGGGSLLDQASRARVEECGPVVCLSASLPMLLKRVRISRNRRPLLAYDPERNLADLLGKRTDHYASFPIQIAEDNLSINESVRQIQVHLGRFHLTGMGAGCDIYLANGSLDEPGHALQRYGLHTPLVLVSDENVARVYSQSVLRCLADVGMEAQLVTFPAGEQNKTLATLQTLWGSFLQAGLERRGTVIALGGGVTTDLAGFAAATFMRGVAWVAVPTSLLAMVDAALGGKTGLDLPQGKNLVGAFHSPRLILADPQALSTLPEEEIRSGIAEVVKAGIIGDAMLFELCSMGLDSLRQNWPMLIGRAMAVKIHLVEEDPFEQGKRAVLNLGHTVGHALEAISNYRIVHGQAVSIGLVAEARLAEGIGLAGSGLSEKISEVLAGLGLPVEIPAEFSPEALVSAMQADKKRLDGTLCFSLPADIGDVRSGLSFPHEQIISILKNYRMK